MQADLSKKKGGTTMAGVSAPATVGVGTSPYCKIERAPSADAGGAPKPMTEAQKARRRRRNARRKLCRRLCAEGRAKPPLTALSRAELCRLTGCTAEEYDQYAEQFIRAAKKARRRWEFPHEVKFS